MRYALIENGRVSNVIELAPGADWQPPEGMTILPSDTAAIGDTVDREDFVPPAVEPVLPTLADIHAECARRIYAACSASAQSNINGYLNLLNATAIATGKLSDDQKADIQIFGLAMAWINAMRGVCPGLVGNLKYTDDNNWPPLADDVATFAQRF